MPFQRSPFTSFTPEVGGPNLPTAPERRCFPKKTFGPPKGEALFASSMLCSRSHSLNLDSRSQSGSTRVSGGAKHANTTPPIGIPLPSLFAKKIKNHGAS